MKSKRQQESKKLAFAYKLSMTAIVNHPPSLLKAKDGNIFKTIAYVKCAKPEVIDDNWNSIIAEIVLANIFQVKRLKEYDRFSISKSYNISIKCRKMRLSVHGSQRQSNIPIDRNFSTAQEILPQRNRAISSGTGRTQRPVYKSDVSVRNQLHSSAGHKACVQRVPALGTYNMATLGI